MPAPRQQRARISPRALTRTNPGRAQDIALNFNAIVGNTVVFDAMLYGVRVIMAGLPNITGTGVPGPCTGISEGADQLIFEFGSPPTPGGTFILPSGDPSIRTIWGGYMAALNFALPTGGAPVQPVTRVNYTAEIGGGDTVVCTFDDGSCAVGQDGFASFRNTTKDELPDTSVAAGPVVTNTYPTTPDPGDVIAYEPTAADCWNNTPGALPDLDPRALP